MIGTDEPLTEREKQVLTKLAVGFQQKQIISELGISKLTLSRTCDSIKRKTGAETMLAAMFVTAKNNLI